MKKIFWSEWLLGVVTFLGTDLASEPHLFILFISNVGICMAINHLDNEVNKINGNKR